MKPPPSKSREGALYFLLLLLLLMSRHLACALYAAMFVMVTESVCLGSGSALRIHVQVAVVADVMVSSPWPYSDWRQADVEGWGDTHLVSVERGGRGGRAS